MRMPRPHFWMLDQDYYVLVLGLGESFIPMFRYLFVIIHNKHLLPLLALSMACQYILGSIGYRAQ